LVRIRQRVEAISNGQQFRSPAAAVLPLDVCMYAIHSTYKYIYKLYHVSYSIVADMETSCTAGDSRYRLGIRTIYYYERARRATNFLHWGMKSATHTHTHTQTHRHAQTQPDTHTDTLLESAS
jgi:hypothetical protein